MYNSSGEVSTSTCCTMAERGMWLACVVKKMLPIGTRSVRAKQENVKRDLSLSRGRIRESVLQNRNRKKIEESITSH